VPSVHPLLPDQRTVLWIERLTNRGCFAVDAQRNIVAIGPLAERLTGYDQAEVLDRHCLTAIRCHRCVEGCGVMERGLVHGAALTLFHREGRPIRVRKSGVAVHDEAGEVVGAVELLWEDEGERDRETMPADLLLDRILAALGRWYVATDDAGAVLRFSEGLPAALGLPPDLLLGMPIERLLGEALFGEDAEFRAAVMAGERREGWHADLIAAQGRLVPVSLSAAPVGMMPGAEEGSGCHIDSAMLVMIRPDEERRAARTEEGDIPSFSGIIARSSAMHRVFRLIDQIRDTEATVLITGESGTGKELVARAIHARSHRAAGPFVVVNCGALPEALLESELFGHARGAFTGAVRDKPGRFETADGGTLFLDEVGDLPLPLQVKLLRVLQERSFERLGENRTRTVDVRVLAATHVDLERAVEARGFRDDLYYRLRVVPLELPPLRQRKEDLELLIRHFLGRIGRERSRALRLSPAAMRAMLSHDWPGNVRELMNAIEYATAVCDGQTIHDGDLPDTVTQPYESRWGARRAPVPAPTVAHRPYPPAPPPPPQRDPLLPTDLSNAEREEAGAILEAMRTAGFRKGRAAELLGMSRTTLWRKLKQYRIG
jgi:transcriptional regulator with PAS, ATPase and Fis domain